MQEAGREECPVNVASAEILSAALGRSRCVDALLFCGLLLIFLAFFGGDGGYLDVREYLDDAQRLWLKFDLRLTDNPPTYNRYALGLQIISGPFVWAAHFLTMATGGAVRERGLIAAIVPLLGAAACWMLFCWARALKSSVRVAFWSVLLFGMSSPLLTYTQFFYADVLVLACVIAAMLCFRHGRMGGSQLWLFGAGLMAGWMPVSHVAAVPIAAGLGIGMALVLLLDYGLTQKCLRPLLLLGAAPLGCAALLLTMNYVRYGHPLRTGYALAYGEFVPVLFLSRYVPENLGRMAVWLMRTPWLVLGLFSILGCQFRWRKAAHRTTDRGEPTTDKRRLMLPIILAVVSQTLFWLCYRDLHVTTYRYLLPLTALFALGLPLVGQWLEQHWPQRGLQYTLALFLLTGFLGFMRDDGVRPFFVDAAGKLCCCAWYMASGRARDFGTPAGATQFVVLILMLAAAVTLLAVGWKRTADEARV
ncbi:MAG TPA: hypothetical protein VGP72_07885 [Planctomycetota bacterium]|jgi:hypothetical protein